MSRGDRDGLSGAVASGTFVTLRTRLPSRGAQEGFFDGLGNAIDDSQLGADGARRLSSAKLPILQCAGSESETVSELRLR